MQFRTAVIHVAVHSWRRRGLDAERARIAEACGPHDTLTIAWRDMSNTTTHFSLAAACGGDRFRIHRILFVQLRADCALLGLHEGEWVRCRAASTTSILLEDAGGRVVIVERDWARFIAVDGHHEPPAPLRG
jgi:hypothetical protein